MNTTGRACRTAAFVIFLAAAGFADEPADRVLREFSSAEGQFRIQLPGKPRYEKATVGEAAEPQHQFQVGGVDGVYLVSYQDNPNLQGASPQQLSAALESGRDRLVDTFRGELLESQANQLDKRHPGLLFRATIPRAEGIARCQFYLVGTRLYQILAIGTPEFADAAETTQVLESFRLLP